MRIAVVSCFFNPAGFTNNVRNLWKFARHIVDWPIDLHVIELSYDGRFVVDELAEQIPRITTYRRLGCERHVLWQKERLINVVIEQISHDYDAICWIDADVLFLNRHWLDDVKQKLAESAWCQPWRTCLLVDSNGELSDMRRSTGWYWSRNREKYSDFSVSHPGFAWAARSSFLRQSGGLFDMHILGGGDTSMCMALDYPRPMDFDGRCTAAMSRVLTRWASVARAAGAETHTYVPGDIVHLYHGSWRNRRYVERWALLADFDPLTDLELEGPGESQGLWRWSDLAVEQKPEMVSRIRGYFASRNEDERVVSNV